MWAHKVHAAYCWRKLSCDLDYFSLVIFLEVISVGYIEGYNLRAVST